MRGSGADMRSSALGADPGRMSVTSCLPDIFQPPQQHALARFVLVEIDLVQVERELQFGELGANLALVIELGIDMLLDHARQPQHSPEGTENGRGEGASQEAHAVIPPS